MKRFIGKILLFSMLLSACLSGIVFYFYRIGENDLPAPNFSNSISFNEKIDFIKNRDLSKIEHVVLGSSMSLNNIESETMSAYFGGSYLNLASWGFKISDSEKYLKNMTVLFPNLKTVIISTGFMDFSGSVRNIAVDYGMIRNTIKYRLGPLSYFLSPDLKYLYSNSKDNGSRKKVLNSYQNLVYDEYGGAILEIDPENINSERWNTNILNFDVSEAELKSLERLIEFLKERNIIAVIAVAPQRDGQNGGGNLEKINAELARIEGVVTGSGGVFVNSFDTADWNDSLFVDYCHLNRKGAMLYSGYIIKSAFKR